MARRGTVTELCGTWGQVFLEVTLQTWPDYNDKCTNGTVGNILSNTLEIMHRGSHSPDAPRKCGKYANWRRQNEET